MPRGIARNGPSGRPQNGIDWSLFEQLCAIQCTQSEIASFLKIDADTLYKRVKERYNSSYSEIYKRYSETGKCSLRRYQYVQAKNKPAMAIWLGKQWLGQKENIEAFKDLVVHELRVGLNALSKNSGSETSGKPVLETQSSISDSGQERQLDNSKFESSPASDVSKPAQSQSDS
jgi:hypothetical protein